MQNGIEQLFPQYLNRGSHGQAVAVLQLLLVINGFAAPGLAIDGEYGDVTAESVRLIQKRHGLELDGNFGPDTRAALAKELGGFNVNSIPKGPFDRQTYAVSPGVETQKAASSR